MSAKKYQIVYASKINPDISVTESVVAYSAEDASYQLIQAKKGAGMDVQVLSVEPLLEAVKEKRVLLTEA